VSPRMANFLSWVAAGSVALAIAACVFVLGLFIAEQFA
jgi:hypothetical protein